VQNDVQAVPFRRAEDAWFWTMAGLAARREGAKRGGCRGILRPCDPDDVVNCVQRLCRSGRISSVQARVLCTWGTRQMAPSERQERERMAVVHWRTALERLELPLRAKGIVA